MFKIINSDSKKLRKAQEDAVVNIAEWEQQKFSK